MSVHRAKHGIAPKFLEIHNEVLRYPPCYFKPIVIQKLKSFFCAFILKDGIFVGGFIS